MKKTILSVCDKYIHCIASCLRSASRWSSDGILCAVCYILLIALSACDENVDVSSPLAMEAWIDSDGYPVVILCRSLSPSVEESPVAEAMVRWGKVTISDGTQSVVMTGALDDAVFPPYSYRSFVMKGKVGTTYTITAEYDGETITASSTILAPPAIRSVSFTHEHDSVYSGSLIFTAPETDDTCRFVSYVRVRNREKRHYPSFMGTFTSHHKGQLCEMPLYRGKHIDTVQDFSPNFIYGDTVDVIVARVEPVVYDFWDSYSDQVYFGNNIFISANNSLGGNVVGGYGVFSARGVSRRVYVVGVD